MLNNEIKHIKSLLNVHVDETNVFIHRNHGNKVKALYTSVTWHLAVDWMLFIEGHTNPICSLVLYIPVLHTCCLYVCIRWYPVAAWNNRNKRLIEWTELRTPTNRHSKRFCYFSCHVASNGMKNSMDLLGLC